MNLTLRTLTPPEFLTIHQLNSRWMGIPLDSQSDAILALQFRVLVEHFHDTCFVVENDGRIVGLLIGFAAQSDTTSCYIHAVAVAPEYRRCGVGRLLVNSFCEAMARRGRQRVTLVTWPENPRSQTFYEKTGFVATVTGRPITIDGVEASRDYYGKGRHMVLYVKTLES